MLEAARFSGLLGFFRISRIFRRIYISNNFRISRMFRRIYIGSNNKGLFVLEAARFVVRLAAVPEPRPKPGALWQPLNEVRGTEKVVGKKKKKKKKGENEQKRRREEGGANKQLQRPTTTTTRGGNR